MAADRAFHRAFDMPPGPLCVREDSRYDVFDGFLRQYPGDQLVRFGLIVRFNQRNDPG